MPEPVDEHRPVQDADAWATACAEDLAAEKARRRDRYGVPPGSAAEELRRLADVVADKLSEFSGGSLFGLTGQSAAQHMAQQVFQQARAAVEPVIERNPDLFDHLAAAGSELLAAYRSAVEGQERRWTRGPDTTPNEDNSRPAHGEPDPWEKRRGPRDEGPGPGEHIDLD